MKKVKKPSVSVGIPTYKSGGNIVQLLKSIRSQTEQTYLLREIIIYSDGNRDETVTSCKRIKDERVRVIAARKRRGMAYGVKKLFSLYKGDIFLLLNDDIRIDDTSFLEKLIQPFLKNTSVGLVSGNPRPITPMSFVERANLSSFTVYDKFRYLINHGHNKFTCDGKCLALSRDFMNRLFLPKDEKEFGNVDIFFYLSCRSLHFDYRHVREAQCFYKLPSTVKDYIAWTTRNNATQHLLKKRFGDLITKEYRKPKATFLRLKIVEFIKNPLECLFVALTGFYCLKRAKSAKKWFSPTWEVVSSTKGSLTNV